MTTGCGVNGIGGRLPNLPTNSHRADGQRPPPPPDPTFDDYDKTVEKLTDLVDVVSAIAAGMSGGKATPQKRPKTAFEIVKREQASIGLSSALSQLLPGQ